MGGGGGGYYAGETRYHGEHLAERIHKNIVEWNLDGVDFYHLAIKPGNHDSGSFQNPGTNVAYAATVLRHLRGLVGNTKTISYSTLNSTHDDPDIPIISAIHPYLDFITLSLSEPLSEEMLIEFDFLGLPLNKIGIMMGWGEFPSSDSINMENQSFRGELAQTVAEALYGV